MKKGCIGVLLKLILAILLLRFVVPLVLMAAILLFASITMDDGNEAGRALLQEVGMVEMARFAPAELLTVEDSLTVMKLPWYDNHVDNTDLRAQFLQEASTVAGWEIVPVSPEEAASLWPAEAAFLLSDATFEARYAREDGVRALYDADTGLFIHLTGKKPATAHFLQDGLNVTGASAQYKLNTHGGFHGDGESFFALVVPPEQRGQFVEELSSRPEWHWGGGDVGGVPTAIGAADNTAAVVRISGRGNRI